MKSFADKNPKKAPADGIPVTIFYYLLKSSRVYSRPRNFVIKQGKK